MALLTKGSEAARTALVYVTLGALTLVWTGVYFVYLYNTTPMAENRSPYYWCAGFMATGLVLLMIGFGLGRLGRAARHAELPPQEVTQAVANADQMAAARAPMVAPNPGVAAAPAAPMMPAVAPTNGPPLVMGHAPVQR